MQRKCPKCDDIIELNFDECQDVPPACSLCAAQMIPFEIDETSLKAFAYRAFNHSEEIHDELVSSLDVANKTEIILVRALADRAKKIEGRFKRVV